MKKQFFDMSFGTLRLARNIFAVMIFALCSMLLAPCSSAPAQQPRKIPRIGYLAPVDAASDSARAEAIRLALRDRGYIEGQNIATE